MFDFGDVKGQKRQEGLEIARRRTQCDDVGPAGTGKTMLAKALLPFATIVF